MLISSPHLARSYHHLFPVQPYEELDKQTLAQLAAAAADRPPEADAIGLAIATDDMILDRRSGAAGSSYDSRVPWYERGGPPDASALYCFGCLKSLDAAAGISGSKSGTAAVGSSGLVLRCRQCQQVFCYDCDAFVHETLHNCPGCEATGGSWQGDEPAAAAAAATENGFGH